jgi:hypothetical protein
VVTATAKKVEADQRTLIQNAKLAIRDIFDAIVELVTNSDDRYQFLNKKGAIEIEVERRRKGKPSLLRVRDFADGMTAEVMDKKLSRMGGRVSGMELGSAVRGTYSRGAKDVAALGPVTFESIAEDGRYHKCQITQFLDFVPFPSKRVSSTHRKKLGIARGTGTVVSIEVDSSNPVPQHDKLREQLSRLVSLRDILSDPNRKLVLRDLGQGREDRLRAPRSEGTDRVKATFDIPGYLGAEAKLVIKRAKRRFDRDKDRFRLNGILVKSRHAIHEATLFDSSLENDPHALWFFGKLTCPYLDDLMNEFDDLWEARQDPKPGNPCPVVDPARRGLTRDHPFVEALYREALKRLRPLVEEERQREERQRAAIESRATRKRLDALERAAVKFMQDFGEEDEPSRIPDAKQRGSRFRERGYALNPPFTQLIVGEATRFWLNIRRDVFPEFEVGATVQIQCLSDEITSDKRYSGLEAHPTDEGILRAVWKVKALSPSMATAVRARVGSIAAESTIEVLASEADRFKGVKGLCFNKKRYKLRTDAKRKKIRVVAPIAMVPRPVRIEVKCPSKHFKLSGDRTMIPMPKLGVGICEFGLKSDGTEANSRLTAQLDREEASAEVMSVLPAGAGLEIKLEDIDLTNQRYRWRQNVLEIAARHPSLKRYLGRKEKGFPGQESKHFRLLLAEIVADAVCAKLVSKNVEAAPQDYEDADWDMYYAEFSKYMTQFLPKAHQLVCPEGAK